MGLRSFVRRKIIKKIKDKFEQNNVELEPPVAFSRFESLGYNCEFGFVLRKYNNEISSFFRWTFIYDYKKIYELISNDFCDVFLFKNLLPSPESRTAVTDNLYQMRFHVEMHNALINNKPQYIDTKEVVEKKYINESQKFTYLKNNFLKNLLNKEIIYVIKGINLKDIKDIVNLEEIIRKKSKGKCKILYVTTTTNEDEFYTLKKYKNNLYIGYMDKFSPEGQADDCNYEGWSRLLVNAEKIIK